MFLLEYFFHNFQSVMSISKYTALRDFLQVGNFTFCHFQKVIHQQSIAFSFWKFLQCFCQFIIKDTNINATYWKDCIICFVVVPHSKIFNENFWKFTEWNFFIFSSFQSLLVVLYNMTDNFLQTTLKATLNCFLEVRRFHQSHPLSTMIWKVFIPLSAPYREWKVWFNDLFWKIFKFFSGMKKARTKHIVCTSL